jgi:UDP-N-acetylglucosamine 2-epimerase (non-hydrolysing)
LRSRDWAMPEEVNRIATDALADLLWTRLRPMPMRILAMRILERRESRRISRVGNIMIDSLEMMRPAIDARRYHENLALPRGGYGVVTLHRPSNVDDAANLRALVEALVNAAARLPVVFPVHPRTRQRLESFGLLE